jgi:hypothetical protein
MPVTLHKPFKLAVVPGFNLRKQDVLNAFFKVGALFGRGFLPLRIVFGLLWARRRFVRRYGLGGKAISCRRIGEL